MDDIIAKAILFSALIFIGYLLKILFDKLNIHIKNLYLFTMILWCAGMGIGYIGYMFYKKDGGSIISYSLLTIAAIPLLVACSFFFYNLFNPPPPKKPIRESRTEIFISSITERTLNKLFGKRKS